MKTTREIDLSSKNRLKKKNSRLHVYLLRKLLIVKRKKTTDYFLLYFSIKKKKKRRKPIDHNQRSRDI